MARHDTQGFSCKRNSKLDSFLKRNLEQRVYERVRACEACVVISETFKKVFMYVVLTDHCIYLTENPPKTIQAAVHFRNISGIELVNDIPDFLSGRDRESAQHIRILYTSTARKKLVNGSRLFSARSSPAKSTKISRRATNSALRGTAETEDFRVKQSRSSSDLKGPSLCDSRDPPARPRPLPRPPSAASLSPCLSTLALGSPPGPARGRALHARSSSVLTDWGQQAEASEPRAARELHLYVVSKSSLIFLYLKNSWNNYIIQSTLMQDPQHSKKFRVQSTSPGQGQRTCSSEQTVKLFSQLTCELFQEDSTLEETYALVQELKKAAQRNFMLKRLFWKSNDLFPFLIKKLSDYLPKSHNVPGQLDWGHQADTFVVCIMIAQTLALMFRETDTEPARTSILTAKRGAVTRTLLMALVREPLIHNAASRPGTVRVADSVPMDRGTDTEVQKLITEYSEAATAVLYEIILLAHQGNLTSDWGRFMTVGWVMAVLQGVPSMVTCCVLRWQCSESCDLGAVSTSASIPASIPISSPASAQSQPGCALVPAALHPQLLYSVQQQLSQGHPDRVQGGVQVLHPDPVSGGEVPFVLPHHPAHCQTPRPCAGAGGTQTCPTALNTRAGAVCLGEHQLKK
ncbi:hypothetical protein HHUSO_G9118 [Huso huso]|uniref:Uncharacterized protein n=1 Tax=Huso huso TaxID=61971 RepID=A0ABR0ZSM5_HUSHU